MGNVSCGEDVAIEISTGECAVSFSEFLGFLRQSILAMIGIALVRFAKAVLEGLNFVMNVYKYVCVPLIFH